MRRLPPAVLAAAVLLLGPAGTGTAAAHTRSQVLEPAPGPADATAAPEGRMSLDVGQARFWLGGTITEAHVAASSLCGASGPCPAWTLAVEGGGHRLRAAIDTPSREDSFRIELLGPGGGVVASADASNQFNAELVVGEPPGGDYVLRVVPTNATHASFRLRAKLEAGPEARPRGDAPLLPNLKAVPPYEFGFVAPLNPLNGAYPPDIVNPPLSVAGIEPLSCAPDELLPVSLGGQGAHDCLRLTTGPINVGNGPFIKTFRFLDDLAAGKVATTTLRGPATQRIVHADGSVSERPAGTYSFHTTHAHFHDDGILTYELFRVRGKELEPAGIGTKSGFCPADQLLGEWRTFRNDAPGSFGTGDSASGSCMSLTDGVLALTRGWGDVYRWQRPGQFMEFAGNGDGRYVARATVDKHDTTLETDETDNAAYALIRVVGRKVEVLERGQGLSPFDPRKEVFTGLGPASQDAEGELPAAAPRDTAAPKVRRLRFLRGARAVRFSLDEAATVRVVLLRGSRKLASLRVRGRRGTNTVTVPRRARRATRVAVTARDLAGNYAKTVRRSR